MSADLEKLHLHSLSALRTIATSNTLTMSLSPSVSNPHGAVSSPMTSLALNLSGLSTGKGTPRRKLSLSSVDTPDSTSKPTPERSDSTESGCFVDSPTPLDSPTLEVLSTSVQRFSSAFKPEIPPEAFTKRKTIAFRRFNSMPVPMMRLSPVELENEVQMAPAFQSAPVTSIEEASECMETSSDTLTDISSDLHSDNSRTSDSDGIPLGLSPPKRPNFYIDENENSSQDSGVCFEREREEGFHFAAPQGLPPKKHRIMGISEDTCSPFKYSPVKDRSPHKRPNSAPVGCLDFSMETFGKTQPDTTSPLKMSPLVSLVEDVDDGFLDIFDDEVAKLTTSVKSSMSSLFTAPVLNRDSHASQLDDDTPVIRRTKRFLRRSHSVDVRSAGFSYKRDPPQDESTPIQSKRRRPESAETISCTEDLIAKPRLHRCHSESEAMIKSALSRIEDEPDLVGDCSRAYSLPIIPGKHQDLKSISPETLAQLMDGAFSHEIEKFIIIDCRYPYEYDGGHIRDAKNLYTKESILEELLKNPVTVEDPSKRSIVIFHCEFSSERGPNLSRFLRSKDRDANKDCYPSLHYPELYLLEGGYKAFYEKMKEYCTPLSYKPMLHKDHAEDLRHFRAKSKSWAGEKGSRPGFRPLKF